MATPWGGGGGGYDNKVRDMHHCTTDAPSLLQRFSLMLNGPVELSKTQCLTDRTLRVTPEPVHLKTLKVKPEVPPNPNLLTVGLQAYESHTSFGGKHAHIGPTLGYLEPQG